MPVGIHVLPIPTPFAVGRINCYLIDDDPLTLVDTGPNSGTALDALETALAAHGRKVEDLERIVLTHQHIDHIGLASILAARSGAEVWALDRLAPWLADYSGSMDLDDRFGEKVMLRHGVPREVTLSLRALTATFRGWGAAVAVSHPFAAGDAIPFAGRTFTAHHRPGHSPSDTVFHDAGSGVLIGGDHLIKHISSNPLVSRPLEGGDAADRPRALIIYLESMALTRAMDLAVVLPGHGEPVEDHRDLIDSRVHAHEKRKGKIGALIAEQPRTAYELAQAIWGNVAVVQAYLTLSEVLGHVDLLLAEGSVFEDVTDDGVVVLTSAA